jgi:hypothetical protein
MRPVPRILEARKKKGKDAMTTRLLPLALSTTAALFVVAQAPATAATVSVIAEGLSNPRGLAFAPNGQLFVAEVGSGGNGQCVPSADSPVPRCYGETGALTRIDPDGLAPPVRVITGFPSMAPRTGGFTSSGPVDVEFFGMQAYVLLGWGGAPTLRDGVGAKSNLFGTVVRALPDGSYKLVADIAASEIRSNPAGGAYDTNPYGLDALPGRLVVADAGANAVVGACGHPNCVNSARPLAVLPRTQQGREPVPTAVKQGPDGWLYVGQLTGGPFFPAASTVYRIPPGGGTPVPYVGGLTAVVDIAFDAAGTLYVLEFARGFQNGNPGLGQGRLKRKLPGQPVEVALDNLSFPGGLAVGPGGDVFISVDSASFDATSLTQGKVIRVSFD